ncbi:hypothetical protein NC652_030551 [Populus alba x Populus x berolinensis]|nr:hypothetical protein NC652_030551 [Populus alba x Populus x berolinensis]
MLWVFFLEQKLRELTNKVESTHCNVIREETSATSSSLENSLSTPNVASTSSARLDQMLQIAQDKDKSDSLGYFDCVLVEKSQLAMNQKWQQSEEMEVQSSSSNYSETGKELECQRTSPVSILEPSFASGSCSYLNGSSHCSTNESVEMEGETELSDSASSISIVDVVRKYTTRTCSTTELKELSDWELDFIRDILNSAEVNLKGFALDQTSKVINPSLFDLLENQDKEQDMSTTNGKWLDFSIEAFEDGVEIEDGILTSLVDELVSDLLPL